MQELREGASYAAERVQEVLENIERAHLADPRPRDAIDAAWTFRRTREDMKWSSIFRAPALLLLVGAVASDHLKNVDLQRYLRWRRSLRMLWVQIAYPQPQQLHQEIFLLY